MIHTSTYFYDPDFDPESQPVMIVDDDTKGSDPQTMFGLRLRVGKLETEISVKRLTASEAVELLEALSETAKAAAEHIHMRHE